MSRVLMVAHETIEADEQLAELRRIADERTSIFAVVAPAVAADHQLGDSWSQAGAIDAAQERLDRTRAVLRGEGLECDGWVGDMVPFAAVRDAVERFGKVDLIVISTHPVTRSRWLKKDLIEQVKRNFHVPVVHVVSHVHEHRPA